MKPISSEGEVVIDIIETGNNLNVDLDAIRAATAGTRISEAGGEKVAAAIAANAPISQAAIGATVRNVGTTSRSTGRSLGHSAKAAAAVAKGAKNSRALRAIGAAKAALKTRF